MEKEISIHTINRVQMCLYRIFDAKDEDCPNRRVIAANERAIGHYLKDYSEEQQKELLKIIDVDFNWRDDGSNCISELEKLGWKIKEE